MSDQNKVAAALIELLQRKRRKDISGDRLIPDRPIMSRPPDASASGWEKAAALIGAALSPGSTIAGMVLGRPQEESLFDREIIGPDGKAHYPEVTEGAVPRMKKVQRKALQTLQKFPTKEAYLRGAGSEGYSRSAKKFGIEAPESISLSPKEYTGTARIPAVDAVAEYRKGKPIGALTFGTQGKVGVAGVLPEFQGQGIGKDLYKKAAMLGRNIFDLGITSQDAARARYNAIVELAEGKFSGKPKRIDQLGATQLVNRENNRPESRVETRPLQRMLNNVAPSSRQAGEVPVNDFSRMQYLSEVRKLINAYKAQEITSAGFERARRILDTGEYAGVAEHTRRRANIINDNLSRGILSLLDFTPK